MKVGKFIFAPYFNKKYLVFKPHIFIKENFSFKTVFVYFPIVFLFLKFLGGSLYHYADKNTKEQISWFTDILRGTTALDKAFESYYGVVAEYIATTFNLGSQSFEILALGWMALGLFTFLKFITVWYIFMKIMWIFFDNPYAIEKQMNKDELIEYTSKKSEYIGKDLSEVIEDVEIQLKAMAQMQRC